MDLGPVMSAVESLLFASDHPVSIDRLLEVFGETGPSKDEVTEALTQLKTRYSSPEAGIELRESVGGYQLSTKVQNAEWIRKFLETRPFRLGRSALEVLAIVAYRQPITRNEIDHVRGIDSSHLLRTLIERNLVKMAGKAEVPGRPVQYGTTQRFLEVVGINGINELPPLSELQQLQGDTEDPIKALEKGLDRFIDEGLSEAVAESSEELRKGLEEIDTIIQGADRSQDEVYESKDHAEVARANQEALHAFQENTPRRRKKTLSFEQVEAGMTEESNLATPTPEEVITPPAEEIAPEPTSNA